LRSPTSLEPARPPTSLLKRSRTPNEERSHHYDPGRGARILFSTPRHGSTKRRGIWFAILRRPAFKLYSTPGRFSNRISSGEHLIGKHDRAYAIERAKRKRHRSVSSFRPMTSPCVAHSPSYPSPHGPAKSANEAVFRLSALGTWQKFLWRDRIGLSAFGIGSAADVPRNTGGPKTRCKADPHSRPRIADISRFRRNVPSFLKERRRALRQIAVQKRISKDIKSRKNSERGGRHARECNGQGKGCRRICAPTKQCARSGHELRIAEHLRADLDGLLVLCLFPRGAATQQLERPSLSLRRQQVAPNYLGNDASAAASFRIYGLNVSIVDSKGGGRSTPRLPSRLGRPRDRR